MCDPSVARANPTESTTELLAAMTKPSSFLAFLLLSSGSAAFALALRHDVEEKSHLELGKRFPAVVPISGLGSGTLIDSHWVLTAAHVPEMLERMAPDRPIVVRFGDVERKVEKFVTPPERAKDRKKHDIALLRLASPAPKSVDPVALWEKKPKAETEFVIAGWGILAKGDEGIEPSPAAMAAKTRARRAGWNVIDEFDEDESMLLADFDGPKEGHDLEASPCIGDSGGPALFRVEGEDDEPDRWYVAGVIGHIDDTDEDHVIGEYGDQFGVTAIHGYLDWVQATIKD